MGLISPLFSVIHGYSAVIHRYSLFPTVTHSRLISPKGVKLAKTDGKEEN